MLDVMVMLWWQYFGGSWQLSLFGMIIILVWIFQYVIYDDRLHYATFSVKV